MKYIAWGIVIIIIFTIRVIWYESHHVSRIPVDWYETKQSFDGVIVRDPDRGLTRTRIVVRHSEYGKLLITIAPGIPVDYGDHVVVSGKIRKPESFETDTHRIFNYPKYLAVSNIYATMRADTIETIDHNQGNLLVKFLYDIKKKMVTTMKLLLDSGPTALLAGIVVGEQSLFPRETLDHFQLAGLTHIIVLSGYNITIVVTLFVTVFAYLGFGYRARRIGAMIAIPLFVIMTGMGTSLIRAAIMASIAIMLQITLRPDYSFRVLIITAGVMIFHNPRIFLHSPSFHLSFLAFIGLVYVVPIGKYISEKIIPNINLWGLRDVIIETCSIQAFVLPYIIWMSGRFSILSVVANALIIPMIPLLMFSGFFATLVAMVFFPLGMIAVIPVAWGLRFILWTSEYVASFTSIAVVVKPFSVWWMIMIYGIIIVIIRIVYKKNYVF
jgi:competence protein ComEC